MNGYRFILDNARPNRLFICPHCEKRELKRYIDTETGEFLGDHVGRCNREVNCGYHYTPREFFAEPGNQPSEPGLNGSRRTTGASRENVTAGKREELSSIPVELFRDSLDVPNGELQNNLIRFLVRRFHHSITEGLITRYFIGSSPHWKGATIFWQVDGRGRVRAGKVMLYDSHTGRRNKEKGPTWVHSIADLPNYHLSQCFFGEHLLRTDPIGKPVAVVESEKTALIANIYLPEYVWLATGGMQNLSVDRCRILSGRTVLLYPDLGCVERWQAIADRVTEFVDCRIVVSDLLETVATDRERAQELDIADYLIRTSPEFGWALSEGGYPLFWDR